MKFDVLDERMRALETAHDYCVPPGLYIIARIDGRNFTRLTKEVHQFESPYDVRVRDYMTATTAHLMNCGFKVIYGYTQSDEISLLFHPGITTFERKMRKYNSVLAGEASAKFSLLLGDQACFDCRISELPTPEHVCDYFRWRNEDAHRNALNSHCYWMLRKEGQSVAEATASLNKMSVADKKALLWSRNVNFNDIPLWQKRGIGLYWETYEKPAKNPITGESVVAVRRRLKIDLELPIKEQYSSFINTLIDAPIFDSPLRDESVTNSADPLG